MALKYLTVQDVLWINLETTRKRNGFSYAMLEEATYYQYAYGESDTLLPQAARFLNGFNKRQPFDGGNSVTCFVAALAFLRANNQCLKLSDDQAVAWLDSSSKSRETALSGLGDISTEDEHSHESVPVRVAIQSVLIDYPKSIRVLVGRD